MARPVSARRTTYGERSPVRDLRQPSPQADPPAVRAYWLPCAHTGVMDGARRLVCFVAICVVTTLVSVACTSGGHAAGPTAASGASQATASPSRSQVGCVRATNLDIARDGVISAGPFKSNRGHWQHKPGTKLWVRSSVDQAPTTAKITAHPIAVNGISAPVTKRRGPDQIAQLSGKDATGLFFPGAFRLPKRGVWKIVVRIGSDTGCFRVSTAG